MLCSYQEIIIGLTNGCDLFIGLNWARLGVFPESGISWVDREFETISTRKQDKFLVRDEDIKIFREQIPAETVHKVCDQREEQRPQNKNLS